MVYIMENLKKNAGFGATPRLGIRNPHLLNKNPFHRKVWSQGTARLESLDHRQLVATSSISMATLSLLR